MKLILCVDNSLGMAFFQKRQSRDSILAEDVLNSFERIVADGYSRKLFGDSPAVKYVSLADYTPESDDTVFTELIPPSRLAAKAPADQVILYHWNRDYPADLHFDLDLSSYRLTDTAEFAGSSHEKITKETYIK